jgi:hypothetical protein
MRFFALLTGFVASVLAVGGAPTDAPPAEIPSAEVVREIAKIQAQLGGSIVQGSDLESLASSPHSSPPPVASPSPVAILRDAAWQLDKSAQQLELADLYTHADELRALASELRMEARQMKSAAEKSE